MIGMPYKNILSNYDSVRKVNLYQFQDRKGYGVVVLLGDTLVFVTTRREPDSFRVFATFESVRELFPGRLIEFLPDIKIPTKKGSV